MPTPPEGRQAYLDHQMNTIPHGRVVKSAQIGGAYYAAVEINDPDRAPEPFTIAVICVSTLHEAGREFCYSDMTESMGPGHHLGRCPMGILNCLTPVERLQELGIYNDDQAESAQRWRERCLADARRPRLKAGDRIRTPYKLRFQDGLEADTFVKVNIPRRRNVFKIEGSDDLVRLRPGDIRVASVL